MGWWSHFRTYVFGPPLPPLNVNLDDLRAPANPSKPCIVPECGGTMEYGLRLYETPGDFVASELLAQCTFVCDKDGTHVEVLSRDVAKAVCQEHRRRKKEAFDEMLRRIKQARAEKGPSETGTALTGPNHRSFSQSSLQPRAAPPHPKAFEHLDSILETA